MAIIENDIQYNWVRKRVAKLKERVDETTPSDNRYRLELELLSKLEKEYSVEHAAVLKAAEEAVISNLAKTQVNIYKGLPMILEKVKGIALASVIGKPSSWLNHKLINYVVNGIEKRFFASDLELINTGLESLGQEIALHLIQYNADREDVIKQVRELSNFIIMPYIYDKVLKQKRQWYNCRMLPRKPGGKASSFKEDDILKINMAVMQITNELKSTEFIL